MIYFYFYTYMIYLNYTFLRGMNKMNKMKKLIILPIIITTILLSGCTKTKIDNTTDAYNYLTKQVSNNSTLNIDLLRSAFGKLKYNNVSSQEIPMFDNNEMKKYSAHSFSDDTDKLTVYFENDEVIYIHLDNKSTDASVDLEYVTNENIEELTSNFKDSNSLRIRYKSSNYAIQEQLIDLINEEVNNDSLILYKELVDLLTTKVEFTIEDIERILEKEYTNSENRELDNKNVNFYIFDLSDSSLGVFIDNSNKVQSITVNNLNSPLNTTKTTFVFEFTPYDTDKTFRTSVYHIDTPIRINNFNKNTLDIIQ